MLYQWRHNDALVIFITFALIHCCPITPLSLHGPLARNVTLRVAHAPGMPGTFSPPPRVSDPDMYHGTCVTHVPWCMLGSLTNGFLWSRWQGKRSAIPGACATRNFTYLVRGPWLMANFGSSDGLLPNGTKPSPEAMLSYYTKSKIIQEWESYHIINHPVDKLPLNRPNPPWSDVILPSSLECQSMQG